MTGADARRTMEPSDLPPNTTAVSPMHRHKPLFIVLLVVWVAWMALLVVMYFTTIYPSQHRASESSPNVTGR